MLLDGWIIFQMTGSKPNYKGGTTQSKSKSETPAHEDDTG
jgi:hypothetical protein